MWVKIYIDSESSRIVDHIATAACKPFVLQMDRNERAETVHDYN